MFAGSAPSAQAATFTVTKLADTADGVCNADCSLSEAIEAANADNTAASDTINFAGGLTGVITLDAALGELMITAPLVINGPGQNVISVSGNNATRVFSISGGTTANPVTINNLTITAGNSADNTTTSDTGGAVSTADVTKFTNVTVSNSSSPGAGTTAVGGGGIFNAGVLTLNTSTITGNTATNGLGNGGGILNTGTLNVTGGSISNNDAGRAGGGIENNGGSVGLTNVTLTGNTANINGGALHIGGAGTANVIGGTVQNNIAAQEGGGLWNSKTGVMNISANTLIQSNQAQGAASDQGGGGLFSDGGKVTIAGARFFNNSASGTLGSGGGIFNNGAIMDITGAVMLVNTATRAGGALESLGGTVTVVSSMLGSQTVGEGNKANINGGSVHITGAGTVSLKRTVVGQNSATKEGGGLWNSSTGTLNLDGVLVFNNVAGGDDVDQGGGGIYNDGGVVNVSGDGAAVFSNAATGAAGSGGGLLNVGGTINLTNAVFADNAANRAGGAIETNAGTVNLTNVNLGGDVAALVAPFGVTLPAAVPPGNTAGAAPGNGGGLHTTGAGTVTVNGGAVQDNVAGNEGGGLWNSKTGTLKVTGTTIARNTAQGNAADKGGGGGIYNDGGATSVTNAVVTNNVTLAEAVGRGGGGVFNNGALTVTGSNLFANRADTNQATTGRGNGGGILNTAAGVANISGGSIVANRAARAGGGIENAGGNVNLVDVILGGPTATAGNFANINGGGLHSGGGTVAVTRGTVVNNVAGQEGGGLWAAGTLNVTGTGISQNTANGDGTKQGGGGVFVETGGTTNISGATISNNIATAQAVGNGGGGIFNDARLALVNTTISGNLANTNQDAAGRGNGGGVLNTDVGTVTINGGTISGNRASRAGGGIENVGGTLAATGLILSGNFANINGGGLHSGGGTVTISDSTVQNNVATQEGGGLWAAGTLNVARGSVVGNTANGDGTKQGGGGIFVETGGTTNINSTEIRANVATASAVGNGGGGIFNDATLNLTNVAIADNTATNGTGNGGGILNRGTVIIEGGRISGNKAARAGGGIENDGASSFITALSLFGNSAGVNGGGLHIGGRGGTTLVRSVVYNNQAGNQGGGLWTSAEGFLGIDNSTVSGNRATNAGGGLYVIPGSSTSLMFLTITNNQAATGGGVATDSSGVGGAFLNSIIAANTGGSAPDVSGALKSNGYNLIGVTDGGSGFADTDKTGTASSPLDPKLAPLANNGGPTLTHSLLAGSPALNGGIPTPPPSGPQPADFVDQRGPGFPRLRAGRIDIGALELQIDAPTANNVTVSTDEDATFTFTTTTFDAGFQSTNSSNQAQTVRIDSLPANGTLTLNGTAVTAGQTIARADLVNLTYAPNANFNGSDSLNFAASDGFITTGTATLTITVVPVNDAPVANSQKLRADNATPLKITLTSSDLDGDALTYVIGKDLPNSTRPEDKGIGPIYGKLSGVGPNLTYTAPAGYVGRDVFTFYVSDGVTNSQQARVEILVSGARGLSAGNDSFTLILGASDQIQQKGVTLLANGVFRIAAPGVLVNDFRGQNVDKATPKLARSAQNGRVKLNADGGFDYMPNGGFAGTDLFAYEINDGRTKATAIVRLIVSDRRAPELRFDTPRNGAVVKTVDKIAGRVRDRNAGLKSLTLVWQRFDGKVWNGSAWVMGTIELPLVVQGINWIYNGNLPEPGDDPATDLLDGKYDLRVTATDKSNNRSRLTNTITVRNAAPEMPDFSEVRLSSAGASAAQNAIQLRFTGALDAASAGDAMNYVIAVNGVEIETGAVAYAENVVTLNGFALEEGDEIALGISSLKDAAGKTLKAGTITLIAR